eukprot:TRINITY_DN4867_c0_g1_i4.p1 TRINITY_DN4867_c0_g1~~TRINITY_DN4867_c0_g1_i4.p1  ORF type:complete len:497 (-),score=91.99 TRINITY_DN4867_c0_g1_i4:134-1624(-)
MVAAGVSPHLTYDDEKIPTNKDLFDKYFYLGSFAIPRKILQDTWSPYLSSEVEILLDSCAVTHDTVHIGYFYRLVKALLEGHSRTKAFDTIIDCAAMWRKLPRFGLCTRAWSYVVCMPDGSYAPNSRQLVADLLLCMLTIDLPVELETLQEKIAHLDEHQFDAVVRFATEVGLISKQAWRGSNLYVLSFSCPFVRNMCFMQLSQMNKRQVTPLFAKAGIVHPYDAASVVMLAASLVDWKTYWATERTTDGLPYERVFQQHIFFPLCSVCTATQTVSPEMYMGAFMKGAQGWVDHWIDGPLRIALEWLVLRSHGQLQDHLERFGPGGRYLPSTFQAACVAALCVNPSEDSLRLARQWNSLLAEHKTVCVFLQFVSSAALPQIIVPGLAEESAQLLPTTLQAFSSEWHAVPVVATEMLHAHRRRPGVLEDEVPAKRQHLATVQQQITEFSNKIAAVGADIIDALKQGQLQMVAVLEEQQTVLQEQQAVLEAQQAKLKA